MVWEESLRQAFDMLEWWKMQHTKGVRSTARNISTLTLHVLSCAGFGKSYSFQGSMENLKEAGPMNHRDALSLILENTILVLVLSPKFLARLSRPKKLARLGQATVTFKKYMTDILEEEKNLMAQGKSGKGNLMTSLIRASDEEVEVAHTSKNTTEGSLLTRARGELTENEIYGNMFVFNFAGHDTTAQTLVFTINLLAAHPEVQDWMREELQHYLPGDAHSNWSYEEVFPKLKRCLAVFVSILADLQSLKCFLLSCTSFCPSESILSLFPSLKPSASMIPSSVLLKPRSPGPRHSLWLERPYTYPQICVSTLISWLSMFTLATGAQTRFNGALPVG